MRHTGMHSQFQADTHEAAGKTARASDLNLFFTARARVFTHRLPLATYYEDLTPN
jgi:hypothetical protein